jgi:hypothetical protein
MNEDRDAHRSVEALQAYLIAYMQSRSDPERAVLTERMRGEDGFMAAALGLLRAVHDAMVCCLRADDVQSEGRIDRLLDSEDLFDSDLASMALFTLAKFAPAIVMDLDRPGVPAARKRLDDLLARAGARSVALRLH